jgi:hypothetical protein
LAGSIDENESGSWPTPHGFSQDGKSHGPSGNELGNAVNKAMFPTPTVQDGENNGGPSQYNRNSIPLNALVKMWPTPASNSGTGGCTGLAGGSGNRLKLYQMLGEEEGKKMGCQSLNPYWVEWLMGWPLGWTDLKPLGMDKFRRWLQQHGRF